MPKFSIIIPTHNSEKFCRKCFDSVASQTYKNYELIIVCDKCKDGTEKIAREYTDKVVITDLGNDSSRNAGLDIATGEWVLFLDDDDWWLHEYVLEQLANRVGKHDEDILCFSFIFKGVGYAGPRDHKAGRWIAVWCKAWRRSFIGNTRFFNEFPADAYFHRDMFAKNPKVDEWDMPMYYYNYLRPGSQTIEKGERGEKIKK